MYPFAWMPRIINGVGLPLHARRGRPTIHGSSAYVQLFMTPGLYLTVHSPVQLPVQ